MTDKEYRATGGPVNSGRLIIPDVIGTANCPPIKPDLTWLQEELDEERRLKKEFLDAMTSPIADLSDSPILGCFTIHVPKVDNPEQLASRVSREISPNTYEVQVSAEVTLEARMKDILDRKQAERDNIND